MSVAPWILTYLRTQMDASYAGRLWQDIQENIRLYDVYDGPGQMWSTNAKLDYKPTKRITNHIRHLINEEARFMFSRAPEITIVPVLDGEGEAGDETNKALCKELESHIREVLEQSGWQRKLAMAGRDCFIGKRVALKVSGRRGQIPRVQLRPSLEFYHDVEFGDDEKLTRIIFSYNQNNESELAKQRIWAQTYTLENGRCYLDKAVYDGHGVPVSGVKPRAREPLFLPYIPVHIIVNDGLLGDTIGQSDVVALEALQNAYNRMTSDDQDALRFNMFPQRIFTDASEESLEKIQISPGSMVDLQTDPAATDRQAKFGVLEPGFNYNDRLENAIERVNSDMYELLGVPKATTEDYKGMGVSGKAMRALYWPLISRCEEKWATWGTALKWMVRCLVDIDRSHGANRFATARYIVQIEHLYPITDDEEAERLNDLTEVMRQARSKKAYIEKWQPNACSDDELRQVALEQAMLEDAFVGAVRGELANGRDSP